MGAKVRVRYAMMIFGFPLFVLGDLCAKWTQSPYVRSECLDVQAMEQSSTCYVSPPILTTERTGQLTRACTGSISTLATDSMWVLPQVRTFEPKPCSHDTKCPLQPNVYSALSTGLRYCTQ